MLSYRHHFHAGNHADALKHVVLVTLIEALQRKPAAMAVMETHAGAGRYELGSREASLHREHSSGIERALAAADPPPAVARWLGLVRAANAGGGLEVFPGTPLIARAALREQDRMLLCELHPTDHERLKSLFRRDRKVAVHLIDGYQALKAFLPPRERRGLVLIDPAYERAGELDRALAALAMAQERWPGGVYALWYPLMARLPSAQVARALERSGLGEMLVAELLVRAEAEGSSLNGSGVAIVSPPWRLEEALAPALQWLGKTLRQSPGARASLLQIGAAADSRPRQSRERWP